MPPPPPHSMSSIKPRLISVAAEIPKMLAVAALYGGLSWTCITYLSDNATVSRIYLPSGLALATLLLGGTRYAAAILIGAFVGTILPGHSLLLPMAQAVGCTLAALCGYWLLTRDGRFDLSLSRLSDYLRLFLLGAVGPSIISATIGVFSLWFASLVTTDALPRGALDWWMGDALGILLLAPAILILWQSRKEPISAKPLIEGVFLLGLAALFGQYVFLGWFKDVITLEPFPYWLFLFSLLVAVRLGRRGSALLLVGVAIQSVIGTYRGMGIFARDPSQVIAANLWFFLAIYSVTTISLATFISERRKFEKELKRKTDAITFKYHAIVENATDGIITIDEKGTVDTFNPAAARLFGYSPEEVIGRNVNMLMPEPYRHEHYSYIDRYLRTGEAKVIGFDREVKGLRKDGAIFSVGIAVGEMSISGKRMFTGIVRDISERNKLLEGERRLAKLVEGSWSEIYIFDAETFRYLHANGRALSNLGYSLDELRRMTPADIRPEFTLAAFAAKVAPLHDGTDQIMIFESRHRRKDSTEYPVEIRLQLMTDQIPPIFACIINDITERKKTESELAHLAERVQLATVGAKVGIWDWDIPRDKLAWEPAMYDLFDVTPGEFKGVYEAWIGRIHADDVDATNAAVQTALSGEKPYDIAYRVIWKNGETRWIRARASVTRDASGKPLRMTGTCWDITDFQHAQAEVKALNADLEQRVVARTKALTDSETSLRAILDNAPVGIGLIEGNAIAYGNPEAHRILEASSAELIGAAFSTFVHPDHQATVFENYQRRLAGDVAPMRYEILAVTKAGHEIYIEIISAVTQWNGRHMALVFINDITKRRAMEANLNQAQRMQAVGQLTGGIAHDFNNLLGVIVGALDMAEVEVDAASGARLHLDRALDAALHGGELVSQLMAFSRQKVLEPQSIDVGHHIAAMEKVLVRTLGEIIAVKIVRVPGLRLAKVDPAQFDAALLNLAINARDAMPRGGSLTIETRNVTIGDADVQGSSNLKPGDYVCVSVADTGAGMTPEVVARIFEPFFTTKEVGKGTGLGLSMVHGFVTQSGGEITVASQLGQGTTFSLFFPAVAAVPERASGGSVAAPDLPGGSEAVLVVEDNQGLQALAEMQLKSLGYRVRVAYNGPAALAILEGDAAIDLLFTDVILAGGMTGIELAERALKLRPGLKVLYTSGYTGGATNAHVNAANFLAKPYRIRDFAQKVRNVLDGVA